MSARKYQLRKLLPSLVLEARSIKDPEQKERWKKIQKIVESPKPVGLKCIEVDVSESWFFKWANLLVKKKSLSALKSKSRRPKSSPKLTAKRVSKRVKKLRNAEPFSGPERISHDLKKLFNIECPPSTVYAVLKREGLVGKSKSKSLAKKHTKRYRRDVLGYLQLDIKYVPYPIKDEQCYQVSCVDHCSSWRLIRGYRYKSTAKIIEFLDELKAECPFPIIQIQTDNDAAFTDKFISGVGVTGEHAFDQWCTKNEIEHRLIPVGQKELNGKVENTHKQDDREFYSQVHCMTLESLQLNFIGYQDRWNRIRATKALGWLTPEEIIQRHYVAKIAWLLLLGEADGGAKILIDKYGNTSMKADGKKPQKVKNKTQNPSFVSRYLEYLEWADKKSS